MDKLLLMAYEEEYRTHPTLTIDNICEKYSVDRKDLTGCHTWTKQEIVPKQHIAPKQEIASIDIQTKEEKIEEFKKLALDHALSFMRTDAKFAEVKEFKDIVAVVDSIDKSYQKAPTDTTTVNVLVQNIMQRAIDDC